MHGHKNPKIRSHALSHRLVSSQTQYAVLPSCCLEAEKATVIMVLLLVLAGRLQTLPGTDLRDPTRT